MFSIREIIDIAIQLESNGETLYREAAARHPDPNMAELLLWMAEEERKHAAWFKAQLPTGLTLKAEIESAAVETMGREMLADMVKGQQFSLADTDLTAVKQAAEMIRIFIEFEKDTVIFYEFLIPFVSGDAAREQLEAIIAEEKRHIDQLRQELCNEPNTVKA